MEHHGNSVERSSVQPRVAVLQDGARRRYAVPLALKRVGLLERAFIDWFNSPGSVEQRVGRLARGLRLPRARQMLERSCPALDPRRVVRNPWLSLSTHLARPLFRSGDRYSAWASDRTARWVASEGFGRANVLFVSCATSRRNCVALRPVEDFGRSAIRSSHRPPWSRPK